MTDNRLLGLALLLGPCAECGNGRLEAVVDDVGTTNFLCRECGSCWHTEPKWSRRVISLACPGCPDRTACASAHRF
jgi:hypothetical protein